MNRRPRIVLASLFHCANLNTASNCLVSGAVHMTATHAASSQCMFALTSSFFFSRSIIPIKECGGDVPARVILAIDRAGLNRTELGGITDWMHRAVQQLPADLVRDMR